MESKVRGFWRNRLTATVGIILSCLLLLAGMVLFSDFARAAGGNETPISAGGGTVSVVRPLKAYDSLSAEAPEGLAVYEGMTGKQLKENLLVYGTYNNGDKTVRLLASEYTLLVNEKELADDAALVLPTVDGEPLSGVTLDIACNRLSAHIDLVQTQTERPAYEKITAEWKTGAVLYANDTAETVKDGLCVTGFIGETEYPIGNKEFYSASFGALVAGGRANITVTLADSTIDSCIVENVPVAAVAVQSVFVTVDSALTIIDGYYRNPADKVFPEDSNSVCYGSFVRGMWSTAIQRHIAVYAMAGNRRIAIGHAGESGSAEGVGGYINSIENVQYNDSNNTVSVKVSINGEDLQDTVTVPFEDKKAVKLSVEEADVFPSQLTSSTNLTAADYTVTLIYNDKSESVLSSSDNSYTVDGSLYPTEEQLQTLTEGATYEKTITVTDKDRTVSWQHEYTVTFDGETITPSMLYGTLVTQAMGQPFDYTGLYAEGYGAEGSVKISLNEVTTGRSIQYLNQRGQKVAEGDTVPSRKLGAVSVLVTYSGLTQRFNNLIINPAKHALPAVDERSVNYVTGGVTKTITGVDLTKLQADMTLTVRQAGSSDTALTVSFPANGGTPAVQNSEFAEYANGGIKFTRGGDFIITFAFADGLIGDYGWYTKEGIEYSYEYRVRVNKGLLDVRVESAESTYGEDAPTFTAECYPIGSGTALSGEDIPKITYKFYGWGGYTYEKPSLDAPTQAGTYKVIATTEETDGYQSSTTYDTSAATYTVLRKEISFSEIATNKSYARKTVAVTELIDTNTLQSKLQYQDAADGLLAIERTAVTGAKPASEEIYHAGKYGVKITLNNKNYVWKKGTGDVVGLDGNGFSVLTTVYTLSMYTYTQADFESAIDLSGTNFIYGAGGLTVSFTPPATLYPAGTNQTFEKKGADGTWASYSKDISVFASWDAGTYRVGYTAALNTAAGDQTDDYAVGTTYYKEFTVAPKEISSITLLNAEGKNRGEYSGAAQTLTAGGEYATYKSAIAYTVAAANNSAGITDDTAGTIGVLHADTYTVTFTLNSANYAWAAALGAQDGAVTRTYTITPKTISAIEWWKTAAEKGDNLQYVFTDNMPETKPIAKADGVTGDTLGFTTTVYTEYNGSASATETGAFGGTEYAGGANTANTYYAYVTGITVTGTGVPSDYALPALFHTQFRIGKAQMALPNEAKTTDAMPSGVTWDSATKTFTATYDKTAFYFATYLENYDGHVAVTVNGESVALTAQCVQNANEAGYVITLTPIDNYEWEGGTSGAQTITFVIKKKSIELNWSDFAQTYDSTPKTPTVLPDGICVGDTVTVSYIVNDSETDTTGADTHKTAAGAYWAHATGLDGADAANYTFAADAKTTQKFVIQKATVAKPELQTGKDTIVYDSDKNGNGIVFASANWSELFARAGGTAAVKVQKPFAANGDYVEEGAFTITQSGFTFTYTTAGEYVIEFTLTNPDNYRWADNATGDGFIEGAAKHQITVTVTPQLLYLGASNWTKEQWSDWRTAEFTGTDIKKTLALPDGFTDTDITETYGNFKPENPTDFSALGMYYVEYALIDKSGNYRWAEANDTYLYADPQNIAGLVTVGGKTYVTAYTKDAISIRIYYAVTNHLLGFSYTVGDYTFGDTAASTPKTLRDVFGVTGESIAGSKQTLEQQWAAGNVTLTLTFAKDGQESVLTLTKTTAESATPAGNLLMHNNLPWNAGKYTVTAEWKIPSYQVSDYTFTLIVNKLAINADTVTVAWGAGDGVTETDGKFAVTYDGRPHTLTAQITSAPQLPGETWAYPTLTVQTAKIVRFDGAGNVTAYTLFVTNIATDGDSEYLADNFTIGTEGSYLLSNELTIEKRTLTVSVNVNAGQAGDASDTYTHTYGDALPDVTNWYTASGYADGESGVDLVEVSLDRGGNTDRHLPVGTYTLRPAATNINAAKNYAYVITTGTFTVQKRTITVDITSDETKREHVYGSAPLTLMEQTELFTVGGEELPANVSAADVFTLAVPGLAENSNISTESNRYYIVLTPTALGAANYTITFTANTHEYFVRPATLHVTMALLIYYGENKPEDCDGNGKVWKGALLDLTDTNTFIIPQGDFKFTDYTAFYDLTDATATQITGSFGYTTAYTPGDIGAKGITFTSTSSVAWGNYVFDFTRGGTLTVQPRPVIVTLRGQSESYYSELAGIHTENVGYTVAAATSTYGLSGATHFFGAYQTFADIFTVSVTGMTTTEKDGKTIVTNDVNADGLPITLNAKAATLYAVTFNTTAKYVITPANFASTVDETAQVLTYNETQQNALSAALSATTVDGAAPTVEYARTETASTPASSAFGATMPKVFHAKTYYVHYRITEKNHNPAQGTLQQGYIQVTVNPGTNGFTAMEYGTGKMGTASSSAENDIFAAFNALPSEAWTYGDFDSQTPANGFAAPEALFDGFDGETRGNKITVTITFYRKSGTTYGDAHTVVDSEELNGDTLGTILGSVYTHNRFGAGYYAFTYTMPASGNDYAEISQTRVLKVHKAELTVTAQNASVVYGENFAFTADTAHHSNHAAKITGYKYAETNVTLTGNKQTFTFKTSKAEGDNIGNAYQAGANAGVKYNIVIDNKDAYGADNYTFAFVSGALTIQKRTVTVTIGDAENHYDLYNKGTTEEAKMPTGPVVDAAGAYGFYDGQMPIELRTLALTNADTTKKTNNKGSYAIYAVWANDTHKNNYDVLFTASCSWGNPLTDADVLPDDVGNYLGNGSAHSAGTYTITSAPVVVTTKSPSNPNYDGSAKRITIDVPGLTLSFTEKYTKTHDGDGNKLSQDIVLDAGAYPVDAGGYTGEFVYAGTDGNYEVADSANMFTIAKANLQITVAGTTITYGEDLPESVTEAQGKDWFNDGNGYVISYAVGKNVYADVTGTVTGDYKAIDESKLIEKEGDKLVLAYTFSSAYTHNSNANTSHALIVTGATAENFTITYAVQNLQVTQRAVQVTVHGINGTQKKNAQATTVYNGTYANHAAALTQSYGAHFADYFTLPTDWNGKSGDTANVLKLMLTLPADAVNVSAGYDMTPGQGNDRSGNYFVSFAYDGAQYAITPAALTIKANVQSDIRYGDALTVTPTYSGFKGNDGNSAAHDALLAAHIVTAYTPWVSNTGEYSVGYNVSELDAALTNYAVTAATPTSFTVGKRPISAAITNVGANAPVYNGGAWNDNTGGKTGATLHAQFAFTDAWGNQPIQPQYLPLLNTENTGAQNKYGLTYTGESNTPNVAGAYTVAVALVNNYEWATGAQTEFAYEIKKQAITVRWDNASVNWSSENDNNTDATLTIENFYTELMGIDADAAPSGFYRQWNENGMAQTEAVWNAADANKPTGVKTYTIDAAAHTLTFTALVAGGYTGTYYTTVTLNDDAKNNYELHNVNGNGDSVRLILVVTTDSVTISLRMQGWVYGKYDENKHAPVVDIDGAAATVSISYAKTAIAYNEEIDPAYISFTNENQAEILAALGAGAFGGASANANTDVGTYIVRALYQATNQSAYYVFRVTPDTIAVPSFTLTLSGAGKNDEYTGETLTLRINADTTRIAVSMTGSATLPVTGGVQLSAVNAGDHEIRYTLLTSNYVWDTEHLPDGVTASGNGYTAVWHIEKGVAKIEGLTDGTAVYATAPVHTATARFNARITYTYRLDGTDEWLPDVRGVGTYTVKAVSQDDARGNYTGDTATAIVQVTPATLFVTVNGSMTYGDSANKQLRYSYEGWVGAEISTRPEPTDYSKVQYNLPITDALTAGEHAIALSMQDGAVLGLNVQNYTIVARDGGVFTVYRKPIAVTILGGSAYYSTLPYNAASVLSNVDVRLPSGVTLQELQLSYALYDAQGMAVQDGRILGAGNYTIRGLSKNGNYEIAYTPGIYVIRPRLLRIDAFSGGGRYGSVQPARVDVLYDITETQQSVNDAGILSMLRYAYSSQSGAALAGMPMAVGTYYVNVSLYGEGSGNYELTGRTYYAFTIDKRVYSASDITVESVPYDGNAHNDPVIDFGNYDATDFTVVAGWTGNALNVGTYTLYITIRDGVNNRWELSESATRIFTFAITKGRNEVQSFTVADWVYGKYDIEKNAPMVTTLFPVDSDTFVFAYYKNGLPVYGLPTSAGSYTVTVTVPGTDNFESAASAAAFTVLPAAPETPALQLISLGDEQNCVYTGGTLQAFIRGFDASIMEVRYNGVSNLVGSDLAVQATKAGTYTIRLILKDKVNYRWSDSVTTDANGDVVLTWTVAKKKIDRPVPNGETHVVNGNVLTYYPIGYDAALMKISGNQTGYGGTFTATVELLDPDNYEWADGSTDPIAFTWEVVGASTVFTVVMSVLGGASAAALCVAAVLFVRYRNKKASEAKATANTGAAA